MENRNTQPTAETPPEGPAPPPLQSGESQWILEAIRGLDRKIDGIKDGLEKEVKTLKKPMRRIERMLWAIIGAVTLVILIFDDAILNFIQDLLAGFGTVR